MKYVLSIAGSDSCGGAGVQADIKTICAYGHYAMSALSALTAQNTSGVSAAQLVEPEFLRAQLDAVAAQGRIAAIKIGMLGSEALIQTVSKWLQAGRCSVVLDPVMVATSGARLCEPAALGALKELASLCAVITPNVSEARELLGREFGEEEAADAARELARVLGCAVLIKGGHFSTNEARDYLASSEGVQTFSAPRLQGINCHGTGCTLSSAIACELANGKALADAVQGAKDYLMAAMSASFDAGGGVRLLNHCWAR